ncbi:MAG: peptide-methionine (S)-S-oxide reductase MsrA [Candidatus Paceibacterota bacterium]|jgi:peptide-methionine (S)-S-oxide reductase
MPKTALATFAAGCFWGVEALFRKIPGVKNTMVGYTGGHKIEPTYEEVCAGETGHAEAVQVEYDPTEVSYEDLLKIFWTKHDPTTRNRQGPDVGEQYRSAIFYHTDDQKRIALRVKKEFDESGRFNRPILTEITPVGTFWRAEEYHQRYFEKGGVGVCHI